MDPTLLELDLDKPAGKAPAAIKIPVPSAPELDLVDDPKNLVCLDCGAKGPVNDGSLCEACYNKANAPAEVAEAASDFADIAANAAENAAITGIANLGANGLANLGVGFNNADGYIEMLRRGAADATVAEYTRTLRDRYGYDVNVAVDNGRYTITLTKDGKSETISNTFMTVIAGNGGYEGPESHVNDDAIALLKAKTAAAKAAKAKADANAHNGLVMAPAEAAPAVRALRHGDLVAGGVAEGNGILTHWTGQKPLTLATLNEYCDAAEIPTKFRPKAKKFETQANLAVKEVGTELGLDVRREKKKDLVKGDVAYDRRWFLSEPNLEAGAGDASGKVVLVVTLDDDTLKFDVESDAAVKIAEKFTDLCGREVLQAGHITTWLGAVIRDCLGGVKYGGSWYIPRHTRAAGQKIIAAFAPKWGTEWMNPPLPIATSAELAAGIAAGLAAEVDETLTELAAAAKSCKDGKVGEKAAVTYLGKFKAHGERVLAYAQLLGDAFVATSKQKVKDAVAKLEGSLDGASIRYALAMEEAEKDLLRDQEKIAADLAALDAEPGAIEARFENLDIATESADA